jgi:hypothetical protein
VGGIDWTGLLKGMGLLALSVSAASPWERPSSPCPSPNGSWVPCCPGCAGSGFRPRPSSPSA